MLNPHDLFLLFLLLFFFFFVDTCPVHPGNIKTFDTEPAELKVMIQKTQMLSQINPLSLAVMVTSRQAELRLHVEKSRSNRVEVVGVGFFRKTMRGARS